jgi:Type I restriction enzyme R protein N terminus (HSDR_N)
MEESPMFKSEDDVRSKLVVPWLLSCGFSLAALSIEFTFKIRLGRSLLKVGRVKGLHEQTGVKLSPRADVLVRNERGENLLIIEVKAPNENIDDQARDQGISYARCVADGNIAPYVVVTNGHLTRVFDSITRQAVFDHSRLAESCASRIFHVGPAELLLRAEALEALISFSPDNLIAFCDAQVRYRMRPLSGERLDSDKKYIPSLFVQREDVARRLSAALDDKTRRVTLLIGHPQVGKTNIVCHTVMERLSQGRPCLFYPAISLQRPLLAEISEDFEWEFTTGQDTHGQMARKLNRVLQRAQERLTIFIDGLNETTVQLIRAIDADCSRLSSDQIHIVISLTNKSATRVLRDAGGNASFLAEEAGIPSHGASLIELDPEAAAKKAGWNCVYLGRYSRNECELAYEVYASAYSVEVPTAHKKTQDPYVLGIAMKQFSRQILPESLDEPSLLDSFISHKILRAVGLDDYNVRLCLRELGREMLQRGAPIPIETIAKIWSHPITQKLPAGFLEAALLSAETNEDGQQLVDFYYGRERDYVIACLAQEWPRKLREHADLDVEFSNAVATAAGSDALSWFLRQPSYLEQLKYRPSGTPRFSNVRVRRTLLSAMCENAATEGADDNESLGFAINTAINDPDHLTRIEAIKLVVLASDEPDDLVNVLKANANVSLHEFVEIMLGIGEEFPLKSEDSGQVVLDALRSLHWQMGDPHEGTSEITHILESLTGSQTQAIRREANTCLGYISPFEFVRVLSNKINQRAPNVKSQNVSEFMEAIKSAGNGLSDCYYGDMCPGSLEQILEDPDYQAAEYEKMSRYLEPIIHSFGGSDGTDTFKSILRDLRRGLEEADSIDNSRPFTDIYTIPLPFGEEEG